MFQKERKNNKRERTKPRIKSVEIVPSDDSDSDTQAGTSALNSDKKVDEERAKESEKEKGKSTSKEASKEKEKRGKVEGGKQMGSRHDSLKDVERPIEQADGRDWAGEKEQDGKLASLDDRVGQGRLELRLDQEDVGLLKLKWDSLDGVHDATTPPLAMAVTQPGLFSHCVLFAGIE